jgi:prepilin signal peptidase PulO-like enzyme (type II secretory pathway)
VSTQIANIDSQKHSFTGDSVMGFKEDYELYLMLLAVPLAFFTIFIFDKVNNTFILAVIVLVYIFGAFGGFGEYVKTSLLGHILIFAVVGVFVLIFRLVEKIKSKKAEQQSSEIEK